MWRTLGGKVLPVCLNGPQPSTWTRIWLEFSGQRSKVRVTVRNVLTSMTTVQPVVCPQQKMNIGCDGFYLMFRLKHYSRPQPWEKSSFTTTTSKSSRVFRVTDLFLWFVWSVVSHQDKINHKENKQHLFSPKNQTTNLKLQQKFSSREERPGFSFYEASETRYPQTAQRDHVTKTTTVSYLTLVQSQSTFCPAETPLIQVCPLCCSVPLWVLVFASWCIHSWLGASDASK